MLRVQSATGAEAPASSTTPYFTRSKTTATYKAAGVLPFAFHEGQALVLLGGEQVRTGPGGKTRKRLWRDFGGGREACDADAASTAAREFAEESLGIFAGCGVDNDCVVECAASMAAQLRASSGAVHVVHPLKRSNYVMFVAQVPYVEPLMFELATAQNEATGAVGGAEKAAFAWVSLRQLLVTVITSARRYTCPATTACGRTARCLGGGHRAWRPLRLHPCFVASLRTLAQEGGLARLVAAAAAQPKRSLLSPRDVGVGPGAPGLAAAPANDVGPIVAQLTAVASVAGGAGLNSSTVSSAAVGLNLAGRASTATPEHLVYWLQLAQQQDKQGQGQECREQLEEGVPATEGEAVCEAGLDGAYDSGRGGVAAISAGHS